MLSSLLSFSCTSKELKLTKSELIDSIRIYQIMMSSFKDGDSSIGYKTSWGPEEECSGDIQGVIDSLDYIKNLGFNAIWLTPIFNSSNANFNEPKEHAERLDSTGYYAKDFFSIDPNFGSKEKFKELVEKCHSKDIYVILDGVFGHWGDEIVPSPKGNIPVRKNGKFNACEYPESLDYFKEVASYWIEEYKIDGWRLDQCYQVGKLSDGVKNNHNYWYDIRKEVEAACKKNEQKGEKWGTLGYMVGECWKDTAKEIQESVVDAGNAEGYGLNSCFDFPSRNFIIRSLTKPELDAAKFIEKVYLTSEKKGYSTSDGFHPNLFVTNHDLKRLGTEIAKDDKETFYKKHNLAMATLTAYSGPITVYYGDEWGAYLSPEKLNIFPCYEDNSSRTKGKIDGFDEYQQANIEYTKALMKLRSEYRALWEGKNITLSAEADCYVGKKIFQKEEIVYILNFGDEKASYKLEKKGKDLLTNKTVSGEITIEPWTAMFIKI